MPPRPRILLLALLVLPAAWASAPSAAAERSLTLNRLPCFEGCPVYRVTLDESGKIEIRGREIVPWIGALEEKGSQAEMGPVFSRVDAVGFSGLQAKHDIGCRMRGAAGTATPSLRTGPHTKRVSFQAGCAGASGSRAALEDISAEIDRTTPTPGRLQELGAPPGAAAPPVVLASGAPAVEPGPLTDDATEDVDPPEEPAPSMIEDEVTFPSSPHEERAEGPEPTDAPEPVLGDEPEVEPEETDPPRARETGTGTEMEADVETEAGLDPVVPVETDEVETAEPPEDLATAQDEGAEADGSPEEPARVLLGRFEDAYNACSVEAMRAVMVLDAATEAFFSEQCLRCGGFDVDVQLVDWVEAPSRVDLYFEQRVRCRISRTLSIFDLVAEVPRDSAPWRIDRIGRAP